MKIKTYHELVLLPSFKDRFQYLQLNGHVGEETFGSHRRLNQILYKLPEWRQLRNKIILRDAGCDLAHKDYEILSEAAYIHHINPITIEQIINRDPVVLDPDNLITTSFQTHQAIHYGNEWSLPKLPVERRPNDTCPWR